MKPGLIRWEHWVLDSSYAYKVGGLRSKPLVLLLASIDSLTLIVVPDPLVRVHPDPYIWQGSLIEWL